MLDAALAAGFCSEEEAAADAFTPGLRREEESVADVEIKSLRANSLASADPGLRQEETAADAFTPGLRHEEESGADVERQRLRAQSPASADPGVRQEETAANVHVKRLRRHPHDMKEVGKRVKRGMAKDWKPQRTIKEIDTEFQSRVIDEGFVKTELFFPPRLNLRARGYYVPELNAVSVAELKRRVLAEVEKKLEEHTVLLVPQTTLYPAWKKENNKERLAWVQTGMGPNYRGGLVSLTACRHEKRYSKSVRRAVGATAGDGSKLWLAVLAGKSTLHNGLRADHNVPGESCSALLKAKPFHLISLHRIRKGVETMQEYWDALECHEKRAKNCVENRLGDCFVPNPRQTRTKNPKSLAFYATPHPAYRHRVAEQFHNSYEGRTQTDVCFNIKKDYSENAIADVKLLGYGSSCRRPGVSFQFAMLTSCPGYFDRKYVNGMIPHGGTQTLKQFLAALSDKVPDVEALVRRVARVTSTGSTLTA